MSHLYAQQSDGNHKFSGTYGVYQQPLSSADYNASGSYNDLGDYELGPQRQQTQEQHHYLHAQSYGDGYSASQAHFIGGNNHNLGWQNDSKDSGNGNFRNRSQASPWQTGFWRRFPIRAFLALFVVLACTAAAIGILVYSDGRPVADWGSSLSPSVYLATLSIVANALLVVGLADGLVICFWRTALHGCTIEELNTSWLCGHSIGHALSRGWRKGGTIPALACIFSVLSLLRGPLNQRASFVVSNVAFDTSGNDLELWSAPELPNGYTGISLYSRSSVYLTARMTPVFTSIVQEFDSNRNITLKHTPCGKTCYATLQGFGFWPNCSTTNESWHFTFGDNYPVIFSSAVNLLVNEDSLDMAYERYNSSLLRSNVTFHENSNFTSVTNDDGDIELDGYVTRRICDLQPSVVNYRIRIDGDTATLMSNGSDDELVRQLTLPSPSSMGGNSTMGGFQYAANFFYNSTAIFNFGGAVTSTTLLGPLANQQVEAEDDNTGGWELRFRDPTPVILGGIREMAFRASVRAARDYSAQPGAVPQIVPYTGVDEHTIYVTDRRYLVAGAVISFASIVAVAATLWGWWELGRRMTASPLEIGKAFGAPLLGAMGSNVGWRGLPSDVARLEVRFGETTGREAYGVSNGTGGRRLRLERAALVRRPEDGRPYAE